MPSHPLTRRTALQGVVASALAPALAGQAAAEPERAELRSAADLPGLVPGVPILGNPQGDVTVAEFFDYQCGYCRKMQPTLARLLAQDGKVRLVSMEWPIFGGMSIDAALAALGSGWQGKYGEVHRGLFGHRGALDRETLRRAVETAGVDVPRLNEELTKRRSEVVLLLKRVNAVAEAVGFNSTPSFLIGGSAVPGTMSYEDLQGLVAGTRALSANK